MVDCPAVRSFRRGASHRLRRARADRDSHLFRGHGSPQHAAIAQPLCRSLRQRRRPECAVWRRPPRRSCRGHGCCRCGGLYFPRRHAPGCVDNSFRLVVDVLLVRAGAAARDGTGPGVARRVDNSFRLVVDVLLVRAGATVRHGIEPGVARRVDKSVYLFVDVLSVRAGAAVRDGTGPGVARRVDDSFRVVVDVLFVRAGAAARDGIEPGVALLPLRAKHSSRRAQPVRRSRIAAHRPPEYRACALPGTHRRRLRGSARRRADRRHRVSDLWHDDQPRAWVGGGLAPTARATPRTRARHRTCIPIVRRATKDRILSFAARFILNCRNERCP